MLMMSPHVLECLCKSLLVLFLHEKCTFIFIQLYYLLLMMSPQGIFVQFEFFMKCENRGKRWKYWHRLLLSKIRKAFRENRHLFFILVQACLRAPPVVVDGSEAGHCFHILFFLLSSSTPSAFHPLRGYSGS